MGLNILILDGAADNKQVWKVFKKKVFIGC